MIKGDRIINALAYGDAVEKLAKERNVGLTEARMILSQMSFIEYRNLEEAGVSITAPSGNIIGPTTSGQQNLSQQNTATAAKSPAQMKSIWPGLGAPVEVGMTVGLKGPNGLPVPGQVSQVDAGAKGVKVKNPTTGQEEWANIDSLQPFMAGSDKGQNIQSGTQSTQQPTAEDVNDLARMRKLAGIKEDASCGATGAGAIAVAPAAMGKVKKRSDSVEESPSLEHPEAGRKTIVGATGPQASQIGKLSANNAARGKKTASRANNGFKK